MTDPATAAKLAGLAVRHRGAIAKAILAGAAATLGLIALLIAAIIAIVGALATQAARPGAADAISGPGGIPAAALPYVPIYNQAARAFGISPFLLMAVHEDETGYSTCELAGCPKRHGTTNDASAAGAMQFTAATWPAYQNAFRQGDRPADYPYRSAPHPDRWDDFDSIMAAGAYLNELGAGPVLDANSYRALLRYKGTPPASIPYAQRDYQRALQLAQAATRPGSLGAVDAPIGPAPIGPGGLAWPVRGPISSPYCESRAWEACHPGIDIAVPAGTPVYAAAAGRVVTLWPAPGGGYGNYICLRHSMRLSTCYAHLASIDVQAGQQVARGQLIARSGCSGRCYGEHLHLEVRLGPGFPAPTTNPVGYLPS